MDVLKDIWGDIPEVAPFQDVDLQQEQLDAIMGNVENFPEFQKFGDIFQQYMMGGYGRAGLGNFKDIVGLGGQNTQLMQEQAQSLLHGEIPEDVRKQVQRNAAFKNLGSGLMGSPAGASLAPRDLGLTSLQLMNQGQGMAGAAGNAAQQWQNIASGTVLNPSGWMITPAQQAEMTLTNRLIQRQIEQQRMNMAAMPDPASRGIHDAAFSLIQAYVGHGMGGGGTQSGGPRQGGFEQMYSGGSSGTTGATGWGSSGSPFGGGSWNMSAQQPMQFNPSTNVTPNWNTPSNYPW